ncbi:MAG: hypothetical protein ACI82H_000658 [Alphaproteobacteria bacterium]|jgi:hypothetical protein
MGTIAIRDIGTALTATEIEAHRFLYLEHLGSKFRALVGTVTKRLFLGTTARTPPIFSARLQVYLVEILAGDLGFGHNALPL